MNAQCLSPSPRTGKTAQASLVELLVATVRNSNDFVSLHLFFRYQRKVRSTSVPVANSIHQRRYLELANYRLINGDVSNASRHQSFKHPERCSTRGEDATGLLGLQKAKNLTQARPNVIGTKAHNPCRKHQSLFRLTVLVLGREPDECHGLLPQLLLLLAFSFFIHSRCYFPLVIIWSSSIHFN